MLATAPILWQSYVGSFNLCRGRVAGPLLQAFVAGLCVEYCSLQHACRRGSLSQHAPILLQALLQNGRPGLLKPRCFWAAALYGEGSSQAICHVIPWAVNPFNSHFTTRMAEPSPPRSIIGTRVAAHAPHWQGSKRLRIH